MSRSKLYRQFMMSSSALLLLVAQSVVADSTAAQRIQWQKTPIAIDLSVGEERMLHFRAPVSVGLPATLESLLRTQTVNGTVYLMARAAFANTRVMVREIDSGQIYLLDLKANTNGGEVSPITIYLDETSSADYRSTETEHHVQHDTVSLTRFAAQQLYAPLRLLSAVPGIVRVPIQQDSVALVPGNAIEAKPLVAWRAGGLYVTAVKLRNRTASARTLDPRTLRGKWLTAAFQHSRLQAAGDEADTTAVYLVSAQAFGASL